MRQDELAIVQDEGVLAELGLEAGDELGQRRTVMVEAEHALDLAVDDHGAGAG